MKPALSVYRGNHVYMSNSYQHYSTAIVNRIASRNACVCHTRVMGKATSCGICRILKHSLI